METKNDLTVEITEEDVRHEDLPQDVLESDQTDWKAKALELQGIAKRRATQLSKAKERLASVKIETPSPAPQNKPESNQKQKELDYAQKAYLKASGVNAEEFDFVETVMRETGKDVDGILASNYFQAELKERREAKAVNNAVPSNIPGRNNEPASNKVDYWIKKGELPPSTPENQKLRREIVNERYKMEKSAHQFSSNPIIETGM